MKEDEKMTKQQRDLQTRIQVARQNEEGGMRFDYNDPYKKATKPAQEAPA